jgi:hemolysin activation/secretion protein
MTITGAGTMRAHALRATRPLAVIIATGIFGAAHAAEPSLLTTVTVPGARTAAPSLTSVVVDGSSVYPAPRLFAAYREQLGRGISRESAQAVSQALLALYERDGYVRPEVVLDNALTGRGVLRVELHEARVTGVVFTGETARHETSLRRIATRLENSRPLRREDVPQALREMRRISGLTVTATTRRDPVVRNAFELIVDTDFSPVDGMVRMNNRGTDQVGPAFVLGQVFANDLLGRREKIGLIFAAASDPAEYLGGGLYADFGVGSRGARLSSLLFRSHSAPEEEPVNYDDEYARQRLTLRLSQPLRESSAGALTLSAAFDADDLAIDRAGAVIREDRLRIVETALRGHWRGADAMHYSANLAVRKGLDAFGSGLQARDLAVDPRRADFLLTQLQGTVYRRFATRWSLRFDGFAQHSGYVLPDSERFKIGGDRLGRGFEMAEIAGDRGLGGKLELRRDLRDSEGFFGRLSTYGFYDIGAAWKQNAPGRESAATGGVGLALQGAAVTGYLELARPLTGPDIEGKRDTSVFAELAYRF